MTAFYPAFLNLRGRRCVVIGGNREAEDKISQLRAAEADVVVVGSRVTNAVRELASRNLIEWIPRPYRNGDLRGAFLAIASPDVRSVNPDIWKEAEEQKVLLNAMDDTAHCHFIAPAIHREGDITVAVSTGGKGPALAVRLRDRIATMIGREHAALLDLLGELRAEVRRRFPDFDTRRALWYRMVDSEAIEHLREGDVVGARGQLLGILSETDARHERTLSVVDAPVTTHSSERSPNA